MLRSNVCCCATLAPDQAERGSLQTPCTATCSGANQPRSGFPRRIRGVTVSNQTREPATSTDFLGLRGFAQRRRFSLRVIRAPNSRGPDLTLLPLGPNVVILTIWFMHHENDDRSECKSTAFRTHRTSRARRRQRGHHATGPPHGQAGPGRCTSAPTSGKNKGLARQERSLFRCRRRSCGRTREAQAAGRRILRWPATCWTPTSYRLSSAR